LSVDLLSDVLRVVRLDGAFFFRVEATAPWCVENVPAAQHQPRVLPDSEHLIAYHVLVAGTCWAGRVGEPLVAMRAGDVVVFPHGAAHRMANSSEPVGRAIDVALPSVSRLPFSMQVGPSEGERATFVCGFLGCDRGPYNPLIDALPEQLTVHGGDSSWLQTFSSHALAEARASRPGGELVVTRLAELMFIEVVRRHAESLPPESRGWLAGSRDPIVGRAIAMLHERPAHPWGLAELAEASATSRTVLAERFTELVGLAPMQYLARWRMQLAAELLDHSNDKLPAIAARVGYASEAAFSRAFKKLVGRSPSEWRARRADSQLSR
jgi:AraC-like DNA-binding protein